MDTAWRNDESHISPTASEKELNAAIQVIITMYFFATGACITELECATRAGGGVRYLPAGGVPAATAAEQRHPYRPDSGQ